MSEQVPMYEWSSRVGVRLRFGLFVGRDLSISEQRFMLHTLRLAQRQLLRFLKQSRTAAKEQT